MTKRTIKLFPTPSNYHHNGEEPSQWNVMQLIDFLTDQLVKVPAPDRPGLYAENIVSIALSYPHMLSAEEVRDERFRLLFEAVKRRAEAGDEDAKALIKQVYALG